MTQKVVSFEAGTIEGITKAFSYLDKKVNELQAGKIIEIVDLLVPEEFTGGLTENKGPKVIRRVLFYEK